MKRLLVFVCLISATLSALAAEDVEKATALAEIFEPDTKVAIRGSRESGYFNVTIITSAESFQIAKDSTELELTELSAKYPEVGRAVQDKQKELAAYIDENRDDLEPGWAFRDPEISLRRPSGELGTVEHVGTDFILVSFDDKRQRRRLFSTRFIRTVDWHEGDLEVFGTVPRYNRQFYDRQKRKQ